MTLPKYVTAHCSCTAPKGMGYPRPTEPCEHGERFITEREKERSVGVGAGTQERAIVDRLGFQAVGDSVGGAARSPAPGADSSTHKPRRRSGLKRSEPRRDWTLANAKREEEGDLCRVTGEVGTELAHILGRKYDEPISPGSKTLLVLPDRVVPLAPRIHTAYDRKEFDLLPYLTASEQAQAVLDAGSMGLALKRISPMLEMAA